MTPTPTSQGAAIDLTDEQIMSIYDGIVAYPERLTSGDYASAIKLVRAAIDQAGAPAEPKGWRSFIETCADASGGMINGNYLASTARTLLEIAAPAGAQQAECQRCPIETPYGRATCYACTEKELAAQQAGNDAARDGWISVDDARKPESGKPVLLFVRTLTRGEDGDGRPYESEGAEVAMGEYRKGESAQMSYFDCYTSPMSDNDWITHWMPLPSAPVASQANTAGGAT